MFPQELTTYPNWVVWRMEQNGGGRPTKVPYSPKTGTKASTIVPAQWSDYALACKAAPYFNGIGFVLSGGDPYSFIDLDDPQGDSLIIARHQKILHAMDSYSEVSPSGHGLHILCKGKVDGKGCKKDKVELYSYAHYFTMTGNTFEDKPIAERKFLLQVLHDEMQGSKPIDIVAMSAPQINSDEQIFVIARDAANGQKFLDLWEGRWGQYYPTQSEADFALINMLSYYSRNAEQVVRLFQVSALGKRDKALRISDYVMPMVVRSFDNSIAPVDISTIKDKAIKEMNERFEARKIINPIAEMRVENPLAGPLFEGLRDPNCDWTRAPGMLGEIADFIQEAAVVPVREVSLAGAIALMAGMCGRAFNISRTGLNLYIIIVAETGIGKSYAQSGIDKLLQSISPNVPAALEFIGPTGIASGVALYKHLEKQPCFVSLVGEFGLLLKKLCDYHASPADVDLRRMLLDLFNKSGAYDLLRPLIYSDAKKNTSTIHSPSFSFLGDSTPGTYYGCIDDTVVEQGLIPRFLSIEYAGDVPPMNDNHMKAEPSEHLKAGLSSLAEQCLNLTHNQKVTPVEVDEEATKFFKDLRERCRIAINKSEREVSRQLWNRCHLKTMKLAALAAVGMNLWQPVITMSIAQWAFGVIERDVNNVLEKFIQGKTGKDTNELNQLDWVVRAIRQYMTDPVDVCRKYKCDERYAPDRVVTMSMLQRMLLNQTAFKNDRVAANYALEKAIKVLIDEDVLKELRQIDMKNRFGRIPKAYIVTEVARFM